jgi:Flp pilus assembly protein TadD
VQGSIPSLIDTRGVVLIQAGQTDKAVLDLMKAKDSNVRNPNFALHLAWAYRASGQIEKARTQLHKAETLGLKPRALDPLMFAIFQRLQNELSSG